MLLINMFGGPGCGKSTTATGVFSKLKQDGINAEYVSEYAKDKVWDRHEAIFDNQIYIFAKQHHKIFRLEGQVDVVITDSPLFLSLFYNRNKDSMGKALDTIVREAHFTFRNLNFYLNRVKEYNPKGRMQNKAEAKEIDRNLKIMLDKYDVPMIEYMGNNEAIDKIVEDVHRTLEQGF